MRRRLLVLFSVASFVALLNAHAIAQNYLYGTGNQQWGINLPIENGFINVANGEVHLEISVASLPQRGSIPLNERLEYDSRIWQIVETGSSYQWEPTNVPAPYSGVSPVCTGNPPDACTNGSGGGTITLTPLNVPTSMGGWRFVKGNETGVIQQYLSGEATDLNSFSIWNWGWTDPSGTTHYFNSTTGTVWCPSCGPSSASSYAMDGSGYFISVTNYTTATVYDANGNEVYPTVMDRNGNSFSTDSNTNLVDTLGRTVVQQSESGNNIYYDVMTIGGATKRYTITTETLNVHTAFGQSGVSEYSGTIMAVESITLPDGSSYTFNYDSGTTSGNYGELESITLPTGGTVQLGYANYLDSYQNENRWLNAYIGGHGNYTFTPQVVTQCSGPTDTGCEEQMTVDDGNANQVVYLLKLNNGAWDTQTDFYQGTTNSVHIMSTATTYDFSRSAPSGSGWVFESGSEWITGSSTTTTLEDTNQTAVTKYTYSNPQWGKPTKIQMWDYSTPKNGTATKEIDYTYGYLVNNAPFLTQVKQLDASGVLASETVFNYDGATNGNNECSSAAVSATSGLPNHSEVSGNRGNLTCVASGVGPLVTTSSIFDDAGTKLKDIDGNGNSVSYGYMCSDAYPSSVTYGISVHGTPLGTNSTFDCSSGLVTSTQDMNSQSPSYSYFTSGSNIGRLQKITYPDTGSSTFSYPSPTETDETIAQTSTVNLTNESILDSFGRPYQSVKNAPEGEISSETTYDATGRPSCVTTAHVQGASSSTDGTTCKYYDVLGRVTKIVLPDWSSITSNYYGSTVTVTDELSHSKQYTYDAFQRLTSVLEPNSSGALTYETDYQYNALDNLIQVDQWGGAKGASSPGDRKRVFAYDSLGRMVAENIPENQTSLAPASRTCAGTLSGTMWTACFSYDANSNITQSIDNAGNTLNFTFDALNRVLTETQSGGGISYTYKYDGTDGYAHSNPLGRLTYSLNNNAQAGSSFSYDSMGRLTNENVCVPANCVFGTSGINVAATYDLAGNRTYLDYPDGRVVSQSFDSANRLTGVQFSAWGTQPIGTPYYSASTFAPPGQTTSAALGNGVNITAVFNNRQDVTSLKYSNSAGELWGRQYYWDKNASNLLLTVDGVSGYGRQFTYDPLNRLTSAMDIAVNNSGATKSNGSVTIGGSEGYTENCRRSCTQVWDRGAVYLTVNGVLAGSGNYGQGSTTGTVAASLAASINANSAPFVTANYPGSGSVVTLTSIDGGPDSNYSLSTSYSSTPSDFTETLSGSTMTGGSGAPPSGGLNETYAYDPFGNLTQAGNFSFSQSFNSYNQIGTGYGYDSNGEETADIGGHSLAFDADGLLSSVAGGAETYVYDPQGNRVEVHGSPVTDFIYFGGEPIALLSGGVYTDLIYTGGALIAEVSGTQNSVPVYRTTDNLGSLTSVDYAPYGQVFAGSTTDAFGFTGLQWDGTTSLWHAGARQFSPQQGRWMTPDPYDGSYNLADPQSLNRYAYVNGRPMWATDPSGLDGGGGGFCSFCGLAGFAWSVIDDLNNIFGWWGGSSFHGSLKPRPNANPWDDKFGVPYGGLGSSIGQAIGLPTGGCEFGACGPMANGIKPGNAGDNIPTIDWEWWGYFFSGITWKNIKDSQVEAWNKGYYSCVGHKLFPFKGLAAAGGAKLAEEGVTSAAEENSSWLAGAWYHFTDARFTAWGRYSKVLVPRLAGKIGAVARGVSVAGMAVTDAELAHAEYECSSLVF